MCQSYVWLTLTLAHAWHKNMNIFICLAYAQHMSDLQPDSYIRHMPYSTLTVLFGTSHVPGWTMALDIAYARHIPGYVGSMSIQVHDWYRTNP